MKIGILTTYLAVGDATDSGIGQHYRTLADALAADGHEVHVVWGAENGGQARQALHEVSPPWSWEVVTAPPPAWLLRLAGRRWPLQMLLRNLWLARAMARAQTAAADRRGLEIIEAHAFNFPALFLLRRRQRPPVVTRISTTTEQTSALSHVRSRVFGWLAALEKTAARRSDALVTHTRQHRDTLCELEGHSPGRFAIVAHGVADPGEPAPSRETPDGTVEFLFVGRFEARKGIDVLLAAIPTVAAACPAARFTLAGSPDGSEAWAEFRRRHSQLVAEGRVRALGRVPAQTLGELYRRCDILVAPSRYESFGLIYAEAMSHGKPVIGSVAGGIPEVVTAGVTGLLAEPGDAASLADHMIRLGRDSGLRRRMGAAARADFLARFSAEALARNSVALYRRCIADHRAGPVT